MKIVKFLVFSFLIITCINCKGGKENGMNSNNTDTMPKEDSLNVSSTTKKAEDLNSFLLLSNKPNTLKLDKQLGEGFYIEELSDYFQTSDSSNHYVFKISNETNENPEDYRIIMRMFPFEKDLNKLSEESKSRNLTMDVWSSNFEIKENEVGQFFTLKIDSEIEHYRSIEVLLYKKTSKSYLGEKVVIEKELIEYVQKANGFSFVEIISDIGGVIPADKFFGFPDGNDEGAYLVFNLKEDILESKLANYRIVIMTYPFEGELELLREDSMEKGANFDAWYIDPKILRNGNDNFVFLYLKTKIMDFSKVEVRIYDKTQKRYIGLPQSFEYFSLN